MATQRSIRRYPTEGPLNCSYNEYICQKDRELREQEQRKTDEQHARETHEYHLAIQWKDYQIKVTTDAIQEIKNEIRNRQNIRKKNAEAKCEDSMY